MCTAFQSKKKHGNKWWYLDYYVVLLWYWILSSRPDLAPSACRVLAILWVIVCIFREDRHYCYHHYRYSYYYFMFACDVTADEENERNCGQLLGICGLGGRVDCPLSAGLKFNDIEYWRAQIKSLSPLVCVNGSVHFVQLGSEARIPSHFILLFSFRQGYIPHPWYKSYSPNQQSHQISHVCCH